MSARSPGIPDPLHAHGAWIYLFASVGAGALVGARSGVEVAMLVGTGFTGGYLAAAALVTGLGRKRRQALVGLLLALTAPPLALYLGAERAFLFVGPAAGAVALASVVLAKRRGFLSSGALATGIAALTLAAPATALAGGASPALAALLFGLLWPIFTWRSLRLAAPLRDAGAWQREELRAQGLREAALTAVWALAVASAL